MTQTKYTFSNIEYCPDGTSIASTSNGQLLFFNKKNELTNSLKICNGAIQAMKFCPFNDTIYAGDGVCSIIPINKQNFTIGQPINFNSLVKAISINNNGDYVVGTKSGDVYLRNIKGNNQRTILTSHHEGRILGLEYIPDRYVNRYL